MRMMAFYGKGGIGKSTLVTNLAVLLARRGRRVLQFGCDPKSDSCYGLVRHQVVTIMDRWQEVGEAALRLEHCLMQTDYGVDCLEVGGPAPGFGCGGRGITKAFELMGGPSELRRRYDYVLFDVLGDVVCGGFSAPMRAGYAREVFVITSGEPRSLFAANNICRAVCFHAKNGARLAGLVGNLRGESGEGERLAKFARLLGSRVLCTIARDANVVRAESHRMPAVIYKPQSTAARSFAGLAKRITTKGALRLHVPRPLARIEFDRYFQESE